MAGPTITQPATADDYAYATRLLHRQADRLEASADELAGRSRGRTGTAAMRRKWREIAGRDLERAASLRRVALELQGRDA